MCDANVPYLRVEMFPRLHYPAAGVSFVCLSGGSEPHTPFYGAVCMQALSDHQSLICLLLYHFIIYCFGTHVVSSDGGSEESFFRC